MWEERQKTKYGPMWLTGSANMDRIIRFVRSAKIGPVYLHHCIYLHRFVSYIIVGLEFRSEAT
jgi:hypothetical protein